MFSLFNRLLRLVVLEKAVYRLVRLCELWRDRMRSAILYVFSMLTGQLL